MQTSLVILIVLVLLVLAAILLSSPTCKNAVNSVMGKRPSVENAKKPATLGAKANAKVERRKANAQKPQRRPISVTGEDPSNPSRVGFTPQAKPKPNTLPLPDGQDSTVETPAKVPVKKFPSLNKSIVELFDEKIDVESEFGITEADLETMARKYKKDHIDMPETQVHRSRHVRRSVLDRADEVARDSFVTLTTRAQKFDSEELAEIAIKGSKGNTPKSKKNQKIKSKKH